MRTTLKSMTITTIAAVALAAGLTLPATGQNSDTRRYQNTSEQTRLERGQNTRSRAFTPGDTRYRSYDRFSPYTRRGADPAYQYDRYDWPYRGTPDYTYGRDYRWDYDSSTGYGYDPYDSGYGYDPYDSGYGYDPYDYGYGRDPYDYGSEYGYDDYYDGRWGYDYTNYDSNPYGVGSDYYDDKWDTGLWDMGEYDTEEYYTDDWDEDSTGNGEWDSTWYDW